jgi:hypothetical protein
MALLKFKSEINQLCAETKKVIKIGEDFLWNPQTQKAYHLESKAGRRFAYNERQQKEAEKNIKKYWKKQA